MPRHASVVPLLALGGLLASAMAAAPPATPQVPPAGSVFPTTVDVVNVDVVVLDRKGQPVEGLTKADFTVKEDGRPQGVTSFEAMTLAQSPSGPRRHEPLATNEAPVERADRWFFVVFDDVNLSLQQAPRARQALAGFLSRGLQDGDQVMVVPASGGAWWTGRIPEDRQSLITFVDRLQGLWRPDTSPGRIWDHEAIAIANGRDPQLQAQVVRRYFENNLLPEVFPSADLQKELGNVSPGLEAIRSKAQEVYREADARLRMTLSALERVCAALTQIKGRKTLLLVSEGFIMDPGQIEFRELVQRARQANVAVYFVDARSPGGMAGQAGMAGGSAEYGRGVEERDTTTALALAVREAEGARSIASDTGGSVIAGAGIVDGMAKVARESRAYYLLGYSSSNTARDGKFRKIEVSVSRPGVDVRARRGYYAPSAKDARPVAAGQIDPAVRAGLDAPVARTGIPLRLTSYVFGPETDGKLQTLLVAEADPRPLRLKPGAGRYEARLDTYVVVYGRDNGAVDKQETNVDLSVPEAAYPQLERSGVPIRREFALAPGLYQARLLVRDHASGLVGSVLHEFEVPAPASFRLSTPILTDSFQPVGGGPAQPIPIARRSFRAGSRLACTFQVYGADADATRGGPRVSLGYRLLRGDGTPLGASSPQILRGDATGRITPVIVVTLPPDAEGEHQLELTVRDELSNARLELSEPFVIVR